MYSAAPLLEQQAAPSRGGTRVESLIRVVISVIAIFVTYFFLYWFPFAAILADRRFNGIRMLASLLGALLVAGYTWRRTASMSQGMATSIFMGALVTGTVGFLGGFVGPMIFTPESNQGPMLGIFITGPLGFLVGAIGGAIYWSVRHRRG